MILRNIIFAIAAAVGCGAFAAIPNGYYNKCEGKGGQALIEALQETLEAGAGDMGYGGLWTMYLTSDVRADGSIWDMYSNVKWTPKTDQCGTYSSVGDCYNREHTVPQSKFHEQAPMKSDAHHIFPTDGKVNGIRSNYPHGECANGNKVPSPGLGRLGKSTYPGYTGTVFEPADEYKGDFARAYFYMAARYNHLIDDWDYEMFNNTSYPAFSPWAQSMLMKWHKQDPVSQKEIDRNEAIYASVQHNRNPFVDHPEMADYIWGDKTTEVWKSSEPATPEILLPATGSELVFDAATVGYAVELSFVLKCKNLSQDVSLVVSGANSDEFTLSATTVSAADACSDEGTELIVTWLPTAAGDLSATLTANSGNAKAEVSLKGTAYDVVTALEPQEVTETSFVASWSYAGDANANGKYTVKCWRAGNKDTAITEMVDAMACHALISGLEAATAYSYQVLSSHHESNIIDFTTAAPMPSIQLVCDGDIYIETKPGEASEPIEIGVDAENVDGEITISVRAPFLVGTDKLTYGLTTVLAADEDRFYLIVESDEEGEFTTSITASWGDYVNDETTVTARVSSVESVFEDFEKNAEGCDTYLGCTYHGRNADWRLTDAGIWAADASSAHSGKQCVRMGKGSESKIEMLSDNAHGFGTVSLWASKWTDREADAAFVVETSADGGLTWEKVGEATVDSTDYNQYTFEANKRGSQRLRIRQTKGARFMIDDIDVGSYSGIADGTAAGWDAFCHRGKLVIECAQAMPIKVYSMDGITRFEAEASTGTVSVNLPAGLYIVVAKGASKRVVVK